MGAEIASEGLKGRVFEFSLGDLNNDEDLVSDFALLLSSLMACLHRDWKLRRDLLLKAH